MARQRVMVRLTVAQALRAAGHHLWPQEKLSIEEISRRLLLEPSALGRIRAQLDRKRMGLSEAVLKAERLKD